MDRQPEKLYYAVTGHDGGFRHYFIAIHPRFYWVDKPHACALPLDKIKALVAREKMTCRLLGYGWPWAITYEEATDD